MFEPYAMDRSDLRRFGADVNNKDFQEEYTALRKAWTSSGARMQALHEVTLFQLALKYPMAGPEEKNSQVAEKPPIKRKKELQTA